MPTSLRQLADQKQLVESVLARWPDDNLYYKVDILACNEDDKTCQVRFEDGVECSIGVKDLHAQLDAEKLNHEQILCCICEGDSSVVPNAIILCDLCQQGYHQKCHNPRIASSKIDDEDSSGNHRDWLCGTCSYIVGQATPRKPKHSSARKSRSCSKPRQPRRQRRASVQPPSTPPSVHCPGGYVETEKSPVKPLQPKADINPTPKLDVSVSSPIKSEVPCDLTKPKKGESPDQKQTNGDSNVESMSPFISDATKRLAEQEMTTEDFVTMVVGSEQTIGPIPDTKESKAKKAVIQKTKKCKIKAPAY